MAKKLKSPEEEEKNLHQSKTQPAAGNNAWLIDENDVLKVMVVQ